MPHSNDHEQTPLLRAGQRSESFEDGQADIRTVSFGERDDADPRQWSRRQKLQNIAIISTMSIVPFLASAAFSPAIDTIAADLNTSKEAIVGSNSAFLIAMGFAPLLLAPLSEVFGRRKLYLICFSIFALLQIPTALAPNVETLTVVRALAGLVGAIAPVNGGGSISDMFQADERAGIYSWLLLGPLLGPSCGPLLGGVLVHRLTWRWIYWAMTIIGAVPTLAAWFLLRESYSPVILARRRAELAADERDRNTNSPIQYRVEGVDDRPLSRRIAHSLTRPFRIFVQPIVLIMSAYAAITFSTTYVIFTNLARIFTSEYGFNLEQVGLLYLCPGLGNLAAAWFVVPYIDTVYKYLTKRNNGVSEPEFRLPIANIGSVLIPTTLFWFAWTVNARSHWAIAMSSTFFYGLGQVSLFNTIQNYYIDSFEAYAASAIAAGSIFRSLVAGIVPIFAPALFEQIGYGWGISTFGFMALALAPAPLLFFYFGGRIRKAFPCNL